VTVLDAVDLERTLSRSEFNAEHKALRERLSILHRACAEAGLPVMIALEGWDAAGKGSTIHALTERLDPRRFTVHPVTAPRPFEQERPWMWRFWRMIPARGTWAFFDRSWYGRVLVGRMDRLVPAAEWERAFGEIRHFEETLAADGYLIVKVFLHISQAEQRQRLQALLADPVTVWRVTTEDWRNHHRYGLWRDVYDEMLRRTHTASTPWAVVPATCPRASLLAIYRALVSALDARLALA
jgi:polyphosphate kinase 2 (PPK2 family)